MFRIKLFRCWGPAFSLLVVTQVEFGGLERVELSAHTLFASDVLAYGHYSTLSKHRQLVFRCPKATVTPFENLQKPAA